MSAENIRIKFATVCDDGRREDNGKVILIGLYGSNIVVPVLPANMALCLVLFHDVDEDIDMQVNVRVMLDDTEITNGGGIFKFKRAKGAISLVPNIPMSIEKSGTLVFHVQVGTGPWQAVTELPIIKR